MTDYTAIGVDHPYGITAGPDGLAVVHELRGQLDRADNRCRHCTDHFDCFLIAGLICHERQTTSGPEQQKSRRSGPEVQHCVFTCPVRH